MLLILYVRIVHQIGLWLLQSIIPLFFKIFIEFFFIFRRILFITGISFFDDYHVDWIMNYVELQQIPDIIPDKQVIRILLKVRKQDNIIKKRDLLASFYLFLIET